jgi:hypothetical protein
MQLPAMLAPTVIRLVSCTTIEWVSRAAATIASKEMASKRNAESLSRITVAMDRGWCISLDLIGDAPGRGQEQAQYRDWLAGI